MLAILAFITLASLWLDRPGLYYDEVIFVPAALGGHFTQVGFVALRFHNLPLMIMAYIGALKAYLFAPVFLAFGVSVASIRVPMILVSACSLLLAYALGRQLAGRWAASIVILLMAVCPTFIFMTKIDLGPMALAMAIRLAALLLFFRFLASAQWRYAWGLLAALLLGTFNKQDFLWFVIGLSAGAVLVYRRPLWEIIRPARAVSAAWLAAGLLGSLALATVLVPNLHSSGGGFSLQDPLPHLASTWMLYRITLGYSGLVSFFATQAVEQPAWMGWTWVPALGSLLPLALIRWRNGGTLPEATAVPARAALCLLVTAAVMFVEIAATRPATGPHHVIEIWPLQILIVICAGVAASRTTSNRNRASSPGWTGWSRFLSIVGGNHGLLRKASLLLVSLALIGNAAEEAFSLSQLMPLMADPARLSPLKSTDVYKDAAFLNAHAQGVDEIITAGWGPGMPLFALTPPRFRAKFNDVLWTSWVERSPQDLARVLASQLGNRRVYVVSLPESPPSLPPSLAANRTTLMAAYQLAYPDRHPQTVLISSAYDITYFGPGAP
jgi:4-amino-4-deoxy-L-arabinose transferase-like glycosyltransferase